MERPVTFEEQIRVTFDAATAALVEAPAGIVLDDVDDGTVELDATLGGFTVSRPVRVALGEPERIDPQAIVLPLSWEAAEHPGRFPTWDGILELSALAERPAQSRLALIGKVVVPMGVLGTLGERTKGAAIGDDVLKAFLARVAERLVAAVAARQADSAAAAGSGHLSRARFVADG